MHFVPLCEEKLDNEGNNFKILWHHFRVSKAVVSQK